MKNSGLPYWLRHNGSENPNRWRPVSPNLVTRPRHEPPKVGDRIGWCYGVWLVTEVRSPGEAEMDGEELAKLRAFVGLYKDDLVRARKYEEARPRIVVMRHESGPRAGDGIQHLADGSYELHLGTPVDSSYQWPVLINPWMTCSCHGEVWPCREMDQASMARYNAQVMDKAMATTVPGICAGCLEPISSKQKSLTFPEESRFVPGAPGPTFHAGRAACWASAEAYETSGRLADNPAVARIASCPGHRYYHDKHDLALDLRLDCSAGSACTGLHGPAGFRHDIPCWQKPDRLGSVPDEKPTRDCGYRNQLYGNCRGQFTNLVTV